MTKRTLHLGAAAIAVTVSVLTLIYAEAQSRASRARVAAAGTQSASFEIIDISSAFQPNGKVNPAEGQALLRATEKMMTPSGFIYAANLINTYLQYDPGNLKAQFYRRVLSVIEGMHGYHRRIGPLIQEYGSSADLRRYNRVTQNLAREGGARELIVGGTEATFRNEADVQRFLDQMVQRLELLRQFLRANKNSNMEIVFFNDVTHESRIDFVKAVSDCNVTRVGEFRYRVPLNCRHFQPIRVRVDRGDLEALQLVTAGMQVSTILTAAYDLSGTFAITKADRQRHERGQGRLSDREIVDRLKNQRAFGALRTRGQLAFTMPELGSDLLAGFRWFKANESRYCEVGQNYYDAEGVQRPNNLFRNGLCVYPHRDQRFGELTDKVESVLRGQIVTETVALKRDGDPIERADGSWDVPRVVVDQGTFRVDYLNPFRMPEVDLRRSLPNQFNTCGAATGLANKSVISRALPDGNGDHLGRILERLDTQSGDCEKSRAFFR